jgi:hypothetical protein
VWGGGFIQGDGLGTLTVSKYRIIAWMRKNPISQVDLLDSCLPAERREERSKPSLPKQPEAGCNGRPPQSNNAVLPGTSSNSPAAIQMLWMPFSGRSPSGWLLLYRSICHYPAGRPFRLILALDPYPFDLPYLYFLHIFL